MPDEEKQSQYTFDSDGEGQEKKKSNKALWIVLGIVAFVIVLCLLFVVLVLVFFWPVGRMDHMFFDLPLLFHIGVMQDGIDRLLLGQVDKAAGVHDHHIGLLRFFRQYAEVIAFELGDKVLRIHDVLGATQRHYFYFFLS